MHESKREACECMASHTHTDWKWVSLKIRERRERSNTSVSWRSITISFRQEPEVHCANGMKLIWGIKKQNNRKLKNKQKKKTAHETRGLKCFTGGKP